MGVIGNLVVKLGLDSSKLTSGLASATQATEKLGTKLPDIGKKTQGSMKSAAAAVTGVTSAVTALGAALTAVTTIPAGIGMMSGLKFNATIEQNTVALETMLGSATKAKNMVSDLVTMAAQTPFELPDLMSGTKKLLAFGFAEAEVLPMLKSIGDAASGLGLSGAEGIGQIGRALGQMKAKTKVQSGEMLQLTEMGIPAWEMLSKAIGKSTAETMKLVEKGLIPADGAIKVLLEGMSSKFPNMMAKQSKTFTGLWSTLKDTMNIQLGEAMKPTFEWLTKEGLPKLIKWVEGLGESFKRLRPMTDSVLGVIKKLADKFLSMSPDTQALVLKIFLLTAAIAPCVTAVGGLVLAVTGLSTIFGIAGAAGTTGAGGVAAFGAAAASASVAVAGLVAAAALLSNVDADVRSQTGGKMGLWGLAVDGFTNGFGKRGSRYTAPDVTQSSQRAADAAGRQAVYDPKFTKAMEVYNKIRGRVDAATSKASAAKSSTNLTSWLKGITDAAGTAGGKVDKLADAFDTLKESLRSQIDSFAQFTGLFDVFERKLSTPMSLLRRLGGQVKAMEQWQTALQTLQSRGVSGQLMSEIRSMGPSAVDDVRALAKMTDSQLAEYTRLYGRKYQVGGQVAVAGMGGQGATIGMQVINEISGNTLVGDGGIDDLLELLVKKLKKKGVKP